MVTMEHHILLRLQLFKPLIKDLNAYIPPTTRNRSAALQLDITSDTTTAASPKRKTTDYRTGSKPKAANATALTVAPKAIDVRPTAEEIEQKKQQIIEEEIQEEKKRKQQDRKNDNKRRNKLRDEAY
ncbi:uncharacterized protein ATC70_008792 [Mucor velutinosus]|uniref:Uncharacterized protein n=1 Tax=Mucor velutinosus TaxID=708070 RepID=A0AAN7I252_9FUNG|nr:hypothetical protein ATC70_008792 [Mucor velutinosus]